MNPASGSKLAFWDPRLLSVCPRSFEQLLSATRFCEYLHGGMPFMESSGLWRSTRTESFITGGYHHPCSTFRKSGLYRLDGWSSALHCHGHVYHSFQSLTLKTLHRPLYCLNGQSSASHRRVHVNHSIKIMSRNVHGCFAAVARRAHATTRGV